MSIPEPALAALRLLACSPTWRITRLPHGVDLEMLRLLDTDGFIKARPYQLYNPTTDPRKPLPMIAMPREIGWVSPVGNPMLAGTWDTLRRQAKQNERLACEIGVTQRGLAEMTRAGVRSLDSPAALLNELDSFDPWRVIESVGRINGERPADAFEDDVRRAWDRAIELRESNPSLPRLPDPAAKFADRHIQLKDWCIAVMAVPVPRLANSEPARSQGKVKQPKKRRTMPLKDRPLTPKQLEAAQIVGECKGNLSEAARRMGLDRKTVKQHFDAGMRKLGRVAVAKASTQRMTQEPMASDTGPLPSKAGRQDPLRHHSKNDE